MKSNYKKLGEYIREVNVRNKDLKVSLLLGVSITKEFIPSISKVTIYGDQDVINSIDAIPVKIDVKGYGIMIAELYPEIAPITVKNFKKLISEKFYDNLTFHRIIKDYLHGNLDADDKHLKSFVEDASVQASETEKHSETCERQVDDLKMAEYMQNHIGEVYTGTVNGVTDFGVFVELENTVEGLIRIENLPQDEYEYIEKTMSLQGKFHKYFYGKILP